jgi:hypothetical protein
MKQGYIPMADGTELEYTVDLPAATGTFPVAMAYAGYCEGANGSWGSRSSASPACDRLTWMRSHRGR